MIKTQNKTLVNQNSAPVHLISNTKSVKSVNCNTNLIEVFSKKILVLENDNISDDVALQFDKGINIVAIQRIALPV